MVERLLRGKLAAAVVMSLAAIVGAASQTAAGELDWPAVTNETKPWSRWWWHGSAVTKRGLTVEMEKIAAAGLGGFEITPIYGVRGGEADFIPYLTPRWMDALEHTLREARRLDLGIDMATGNGWPFGGPWVDATTACRNLVFQTYELSEGQSLDKPVQFLQRPMVRAIGRRVNIADLNEAIGENDDLQGLALEQVRFEKPLPLVALVAYGAEGPPIDLTDRVDAEGRLDWVAPRAVASSPPDARAGASSPPGSWTLYAVFQGWHGKMVERAGPGGEGNVIDHFNRSALDAYLKKFDDAFAGRDLTCLRAFFNDSYEVDDASGNADATPRLFDEFQRRRGYDLRTHLPALFGKSADDDENARVLCDYRETLSDLLLEEFTVPWREWAHGHGATIRNQAHGSPANILDLYAASDIPETEGTDRIQFMAAASAAHVTGKRLVSAEAATWLDEHFVGTLAETKRWVDNYFLGGVNHICYHGACYSPEGDPWPGRLFYASLELQPANPQWRHYHALNEYVTRCQSFLQAGKPDNDVLVYYPIHDEWAKRGRTTLAHFNGEMQGTSARRCAEELLDAGYLLDFISDRQLLGLDVVDELVVPAGPLPTRAVVVPPCDAIPLASLKKLVALVEAGAQVILPAADWDPDVPGGGDRDERESEARRILGRIRNAAQPVGTLSLQARFGAGRFILPTAAARSQAEMLSGIVRAESLPRHGLKFMRRRHDDGDAYFIVNAADKSFDGWVELRRAESAVLFDPTSGEIGLAALRLGPKSAEVRLQLDSGQSCIVRTYRREVEGTPFPYSNPTGEPRELAGSWMLSFVDGGPTLPEPVETAALESWTEFGGDAMKNFSGVGRYSIEFDAPAPSAEGWMLDLGEVHESAEVRLNGETIATLFCKPYRVRIPADKLRDRNALEIDVANLMANRIADLDRRGVLWKKFYNVNMAARRRENSARGVFDASQWEPLPSGLIGPVTLTPVAIGGD